MTEPPHLSLVVPAYREAATLQTSLPELRDWVTSLPYRSEVILVDDGSDDDTAAVAESFVADWPGTSRLRVLRHRVNRGKGAAVRTGMCTVQGDVAVFTDADLAYGTDQVDDVVAALTPGTGDGPDVVVGRRAHRVGVARAAAGGVFSLLMRGVGVTGVRDSQCGLKGFTRDAAALLFGLATVDDFAFDVEILAIARAHDLVVVEIPVQMRRPSHSSVDIVGDGWRMLQTVRDVVAKRRAGAYEVPAPASRARKIVD